MAGVGDSFLQAISKDRSRQSGVLDSLSQMAAQKMRPRPRFPLSRNIGTGEGINTGPTNVGPVPALRPAPDGGATGVITDPLMQTTPIVDQPLDPISRWGQLNQSISDDQGFYRLTGRAPSGSDKAMLNARSQFMKNMGRAPSIKELMYEAQRGTVSPTRKGPSIA